MTSRELWQSLLDKAENEIRTGEYQVEFSPLEIFYFPSPNKYQSWKLKWLAPIYLKIRNLKKWVRRNVSLKQNNPMKSLTQQPS